MSRELEALSTLFGEGGLAHALATAPGGWRDLSLGEADQLGVEPADRDKLLALQSLARAYPALDRDQLATPDKVAAVYAERLGALVTETMIALALDGKNHLLAEIEIAKGGRHGMALTACDVLRPLIRSGASAFLLIHNHPSGDPEPSIEDVQMTTVLEAAADIVGISLLDHIVVAGRGGGWCSMLEHGLLNQPEDHHERSREKARSLAAESR